MKPGSDPMTISPKTAPTSAPACTTASPTPSPQVPTRLYLIGSDTPDLPPKLIQQAVDCLNTHDIVLGPALDGGYYLIACKQDRYLSDLFTNIPWSTPTVLQTTLDTIHRNHHTVFQIPTWQDIDTPKDLNRLIQRNQQTAFKSSQTFTYLTNLEQQLL